MVLLFVVTVLIYRRCFRRFDGENANAFGCSYIPVQFKSGSRTLQGYLFGTGDTLVVIAAGLGNGAFTYSPQIRYFLEAGRCVFAFDYTGCFGSEGRSCRGFPQAAADLDAALTFAKTQDNFGCKHVVLFGHSMGGYAVCNVLSRHKVDAAVSVGGVNSAMEATISPVYYRFGRLAYIHYPFLYLYQLICFGKLALGRRAAEAAVNAKALLLVNGVNDWIAPLNRSSIISHQKLLHFPAVRCLLWGEEGRDGHADLLYGANDQEANPLLMAEIDRFYQESLAAS